MKKYFLLLLLQFSLVHFCYAPPTYNHGGGRMVYTFQPKDEKEAFIYALYEYAYIFESFNITPELGITQAIQEQGYKINLDTYRIYNLTNGKSAFDSVKVEGLIDAHTGRYMEHRIYESLHEAILDYCFFITAYKHYNHITTPGMNHPVKEIDYIGLSPYAEDTRYKQKLRTVYLDKVLLTIEEIKKTRTWIQNSQLVQWYKERDFALSKLKTSQKTF